VNEVVGKWRTKYISTTKFLERNFNTLTYETEFSLPTSKRPIPEATVKLYFYIHELPGDKYAMEYVFETESLKHRVDHTIRPTQIEVWIDRILDNKRTIKQLMNLGTTFESTRLLTHTKDSHDLHQRSVINEIDISRGDFSDESKLFEKEEVVQLEQKLLQAIQELDKDGLGILGPQECMAAFKSLEVGLNEWDASAIVALSDTNENGMIEYNEFMHSAVDMLLSIMSRNVAQTKVAEKEEGLASEALLLMNGEEEEEITQSCLDLIKGHDKKGQGKIAVKEFQRLLSTYEDSFFSAREVKMLVNLMPRTKDGKIDFTTFGDVLRKMRLNTLMNGLMDNNMTRMETYLIDLFSHKDKEKSGTLDVISLKEALLSAKKIILSPVQAHFLFSSYEDLDEQVNYRHFAAFASEMISDLFSKQNLKKKIGVLSKGEIDFEELMGGWNSEDTYKTLIEMFKRYDQLQYGYITREEFKKALHDSTIGSLNLRETEILTIMATAKQDVNGRISYHALAETFFGTLRSIRRRCAIEKAIVATKTNTSLASEEASRLLTSREGGTRQSKSVQSSRSVPGEERQTQL